MHNFKGFLNHSSKFDYPELFSLNCHRVAMSVCLSGIQTDSGCLNVCLRYLVQFFYKVSHWPWVHMISARPLIGPPSPPPPHFCWPRLNKNLIAKKKKKNPKQFFLDFPPYKNKCSSPSKNIYIFIWKKFMEMVKLCA